MAKFCNTCGAPLSGIFCVKCGADSRVTPSPPQPAVATDPIAPASHAPEIHEPEVVVTVPAHSEPLQAKFCNKCGAPSIGTAFCNKCGADLRADAIAVPSMPATPVPPSPPTPAQPLPVQQLSAPQTAAKGSPLTKILIGFAVVVITVGALAAGGVYYVVYRVKQKVHEVAREVPGLGSSSDSSSSSDSGSGNSVMGSISKMVSGSSDSNTNNGNSGSRDNGGISGDPCRLLSRDEVSRSIGVQIVAIQTADSGCAYMAKGDSADMTAKHMSAMMGAKGADDKTQKMIEGFAGGMGKMFQSEGHDAGMDSHGNVPVFSFSVDNQSADAQMQANKNVLGRLGPGQVDIPGIGDQAFDEAGAMMMVRKGDKLIRIMYSTCPCSIEAIKPLAKKLADQL